MSQDLSDAATTGPRPSSVPAQIEPRWQFEGHRDYIAHRRILVFILIWTVTILGVAYFLIQVPTVEPVWKHPGYESAYGYTFSLLLVYVPWLVLVLWFLRRRRTYPHLGPIGWALLQNTLLIGGLWIVLDILLANLLFEFPHEEAHVPLYLWAFLWSDGCDSVWQMWRLRTCYEANRIPIEEVFFYLGSAALLRMLYLWSTEYFFSRYRMPDELYVRSAREAVPLVDVDRKFIWWALLILAIGTAIKKTPASWMPWLRWHNYQEGWPVYLACELVIVFGTLALLRRKVRLFTNVRAFLFVAVLQVLLSIVWEATFALPLGWWNYQMRAMVGVTISPWSNLPIEACFLWVSVGWGVMVMYETAKIKGITGYAWRRVLFG